VENAVRHGIEPKLGGGEIFIRAYLAGATLNIEVSDNGAGLTVNNNGGGAGLANVRARLAALFGERAHLTLQSNEQGGATAILELPR
jgi:LytS/YehU family sensor histidine kinase